MDAGKLLFGKITSKEMNREMKIIFDKHNINIPFPQTVVNQPAVYQEATALDRAKSEQFNREQREASGSYIEEEDEEEN